MMLDASRVAAVLEPYCVQLDPTDKSWIASLDATATTAAAAADSPGTHSRAVPSSQLSTPAFAVGLSALAHNLGTMQEWIDAHDALFAPHGKTTMSPALWAAQLDAGAWAITVATEAQLRVARAAGIRRVVVANQFLSPQGLAWLAAQLADDHSFEVICWVDSLAAVEQMTRHLRTAGIGRRVGVCVEVGAAGGRTGARDRATALAVAEAVLGSPALALVGVSGYEGIVPATAGLGRDDAVRAFLDEMAATFLAMADLFETAEPLLTAGGSSFFDLVVDAFAPVRQSIPRARIVLRSGSYIVHDDALYRESTPAATRTGPRFIAAAHVFARVVSVPEPGLALLDAGKRDVPYDAGLPILQCVLREFPDGSQRWVDAPAATVTGLNDQHAYVSFEDAAVATGDDAVGPALRVGDIVRLGLSHPCTMFDKWRSFMVLDDRDTSNPIVLGALATYF